MNNEDKVWRILSGILAFFLIGTGIIHSIMEDNWTDYILVLALASLFGMYAWRGNNWPLKFFFGNLIKQDDENDFIGSINLGRFKNLFGKKKKQN
ncbi:MAG: hypothetical protein ABSC11_07400 [Smithella sp.]|jgi:hypothetical protein